VSIDKKKIIAFGLVRIIEKGRTAWMEGLRVHPRYKRRGLGAFITKYNAGLSASQGVERVRLITELDNEISPKLPRLIGMSKRLTMNYLWKKNIGDRLSQESSEFHRATPEKVFTLLSNLPGLVPRNLLFYNWYALDLTRANLVALDKTVTFWIGTRDAKTVSLCLGLRTTGPRGSEWCCTIYAQDRSAFVSTLRFQIRIMKKNRLSDLLCIHPPKFHSAIPQIPQLQKRTYLLKFGLFERNLR